MVYTPDMHMMIMIMMQETTIGYMKNEIDSYKTVATINYKSGMHIVTIFERLLCS
jgi:hypothetical protein